MYLSFTTLVVLFAISCALNPEEEHLVSKHGIESKHGLAKWDLSAADTELIFKALMSKLDHGEDSELMHKKIDAEKNLYSYEPEMTEKLHVTSIKDGELMQAAKSQSMGHDYTKDKLIPLKKCDYEMKKDIDMTEKDIIALLETSASKALDDPYKKEIYFETPEAKFVSEKVHLSKEPIMFEKSGKLSEDIAQDKFNDKDVSVAESLYHMKIAGDIETYPSLKMAPLSAMNDKKITDEKIYTEEDLSLHTDEAYLKKVDEIGKSLIKEESFPQLKDDDIEEYLKKAVEEDKKNFYDPKSHLGTTSKIAEDKALEAWKTGHKDIFAIEGGIISDEKLKMEGGIAHEMNEELMKKMITSLGLDKELKIKGLEGPLAPEMKDELIKKLKTSLALDKEIKMKGSHHAEKDISHEMDEELVKKLKASLGLDKAQDEMYHISKELHKEESIAEGSFAYEKAKEQAYKDVHAHLAEDELKKHMDESLSFGAKEKVHGTELLFEKGLAAEKSHGIDTKIDSGIDKTLHGVFGDEALKEKKTHAFDESFGYEMDKAMFGSKIPLESESKYGIALDSSFAAETDKAFKAHEDELLNKEKAYGADSLFHKDKEILKSAEEHHHILKEEDAQLFHDSAIEKHHTEAGAEKGHKTFHDLKAKFFELLRRVLHLRKCHLATMRPGELLEIVNCISKSKDPSLCEKFAICEKKKPLRVTKAFEKCQKETIPGEIKMCSSHAPLYPSTEIPLKIFQCVALSVRELMPEEKKQMTEFEECARVIKAESCGRFKWFRGLH